MLSGVQVAPPLRVARMAAPRALPPPPSVDPVAQQDDFVGQLTEVMELTGNGRSTELKEPAQGVVVAIRPTGGAESCCTIELQAQVDSTTNMATGKMEPLHLGVPDPGPRHWVPYRPTVDTRSAPCGQRTLTTTVWAALSWKPCFRLSHSGERPATMV